MNRIPPSARKLRRNLVKQRIQAKGLSANPNGNRAQRRQAKKLGIKPEGEQ